MSDDFDITQRQLMFMSMPRSVRFRASALLSTNNIVAALILVLFVLAIYKEMITTAAYYFGHDAQAEILKETTWLEHSKNGSYTCYGLQISYPHPENTYTIITQVTHELYDAVKPGAFINIRYLKGFENNPYVDMENNLIVAIFAIILFILLGILIWQICNDYDLMRRGIPIIGNILSVREKQTRNGTIYYWEISYKINELNVLKEFVGERFDTGRVLLLVDPKNGNRAVIYNNKFYWQPVNAGMGL
jgi:hypothetical protein